jgi:hypothetical protein
MLNLVLMVGAGDGKMGGEGESSLIIAGIGKEGGTMVLFCLQMEVSTVLHVEGVVSYSSIWDAKSLSCCGSVWA